MRAMRDQNTNQIVGRDALIDPALPSFGCFAIEEVGRPR